MACSEAAASGQRILMAGGSALDAVEAAVCVLEDSPVLDAGRGSVLNSQGFVEMDALIMDGRSLNLGAVAAIQRVRHPVSLARKVMEKSAHHFIVAAGAETFADSIAFPRCTAEELITESAESRYRLYLNESLAPAQHEADSLGDTVGAVALDINGDLAAATSTGGTANKKPGRVGDSPLVGSGGYADNMTAAVSATGHGESLMRIVISKFTCDRVELGRTAQEACEEAIVVLQDRTGGEGGLIAIDYNGRIGYAFNTAAMPVAFARGDGHITLNSR